MTNCNNSVPPRAIRTYLAGPMSGYPELNFPLFHAEANTLQNHAEK